MTVLNRSQVCPSCVVVENQAGEALLMKAAEELKEIGIVEMRPRREGRIMMMIVGPTADVLRAARESKAASQAAEKEEKEKSRGPREAETVEESE